MNFKDLVKEYININEEKKETKKAEKKHEKKEGKKVEKREDKNEKKKEGKSKETSSDYKGQYPEGPNTNPEHTGKPKGEGLMTLDSLASCNTEKKKVMKESRDIMKIWKEKNYRKQVEPSYTTVEKKIDPKTGKPYHTFKRNPDRYLKTTKDGKELFGKSLPDSVEGKGTPPNEKIMNAEEKELTTTVKKKKG